jgi:hypothetical protein
MNYESFKAQYAEWRTAMEKDNPELTDEELSEEAYIDSLMAEDELERD